MRNKYYFLGICGISMSTLAIMLKKSGHFVSGNDKSDDATLEFLKKEGIVVDKNINKIAIKDADVIVRSSAVKDDDPQIVYAKKLGKKIISRGEMLGEISKKYKKVIAVAGSHGKTTTTAMIYEILKAANKKPTLHLGGYRIENGKNYDIGKDEFFVTEACEYHDNFLFLKPTIAVVTNIEKEHMDYFKTFTNQCKSFDKFKRNSQIVVDSCRDYSAKNVCHDTKGGLCFDLCFKESTLMCLQMKIFEEINTQNVIFAYQVAKKLKIDDKTIKYALENFEGVKTRFEKVCCKHFDTAICDYAHHPTEISKTIESARKIFNGRKILFVFQPHTFSRTKNLQKEFVEVLSKVDMPILFKTYSARENPTEGISAYQLCKILKKQKINSKYFASYEALQRFLLKFDRKCVIVFVGAGDLPRILNKNKFIS